MPRRLVPLLVSLVLAVSACGGGGDPDAGGGVTAPGVPTPDTSVPADDPTAPAGDTSSRPPAGSCTDLPEAPDGRYTVADAGSAEVRREGDVLVVGEVSPAQGWTHEVTEAEDTEVEVEFRRDGEELDLEVELDDGRVTAEVCADDD